MEYTPEPRIEIIMKLYAGCANLTSLSNEKKPDKQGTLMAKVVEAVLHSRAAVFFALIIYLILWDDELKAIVITSKLTVHLIVKRVSKSGFLKNRSRFGLKISGEKEYVNLLRVRRRP